MSQEKKVVAEMKLSLSEEKNLGFIESIAKTNTEKITREILEGLSEDTGESDSYDVESGGEDSEDRPCVGTCSPEQVDPTGECSDVNRVFARDGNSSVNLASQGHCAGVFIGI